MRAAVIAVALATRPAPAADLTDNQRQAECGVVEGKVSCPAPGLGRCWSQGHDPNLDQSPASLDVGDNPGSPDHGHAERCSGYTAPAPLGASLGADALASGKPALPPLPTSNRVGRRLIETVETTDVAVAHAKGVLIRAYNQNWTFDEAKPAAKTREPDTVTWVFCSRSHPAVIEPIRSGDDAGKFTLAFLAPEAQSFYNHANELEIAEFFLVCHGRKFDALSAEGPAFAKAVGYTSAHGDAERIIDKPEDVLTFVY
ncbi:hypothetical protein DFR50_15033 [Roseiarcus fermentans]|uniref:Uncharacterized protein n=1 Tax=Roseiarcus fermentans TaxID=1473586 RepID=A0A366ELT9_9HYPH|nr:hypothetical protein [Roseiarcus fermentans]RBP02700.1 hypothetical protein DFR50_15033 [Roseiarcus fermentans]